MNKNPLALMRQETPLERDYSLADHLLPYQLRWACDPSRWKFGLMARQVGKDFSSGFEGIADCALAEIQGRKIDWLIAAPSERQSLESLDRWKSWAKTFNLVITSDEKTYEGSTESMLKAATITFRGGSRVIAVPGKPETVRGYPANVLLTEFAFFEQPNKTLRSLLPSTSNEFGGVKKVRIITTPNGIGNVAHGLWAKNYNPGSLRRSSPAALALPWSCHFIDIHGAVEDGLPADIEALKAALNDPEGWAQEFECQFLDAQATLLPYDLMAPCESLEATAAAPPDFWQSGCLSPIFVGIDFGRRHDLTVAWTVKRVGDVLHTIDVLEMAQTPTPEQVERLRPRLRLARRVSLDYNGGGIGLGDYLVKEFSEWDPAKHKFGKIELCNFSNPLKLEIFSKLRIAFERRGVRVPVNRTIREDLHSVNRVSTPTGQITYRAPYNADGHADRCTALALALRAAGDDGLHPSAAWRPSGPGSQPSGEERIKMQLEQEKNRFFGAAVFR